MKIGIVGLGLIGGSLGLDLRSQGKTVLGVSRQKKTCQEAERRGAVDHASQELAMLKEANIIFLCTPIDKIVPTLAQLVTHLSPETIVTDVASVKTTIVESASQLWPRFVGGHPMAGTEHQGIAAAQPNLFNGAAYVLTPTAETPTDAVEAVRSLIALLRSRYYHCPPEIHDAAVAWISHLPVMVSAALIEACRGENNIEVSELMQQLASSGFRDTSRVGGGNPDLGVMMAKYNRENLLCFLINYRQALEQIISQVAAKDWENLSASLMQTRDYRQLFLPESGKK